MDSTTVYGVGSMTINTNSLRISGTAVLFVDSLVSIHQLIRGTYEGHWCVIFDNSLARISSTDIIWKYYCSDGWWHEEYS